MSKTLRRYTQRFETVFPAYLPDNPDHLGEVYHAVRYSFEAGGKRLRPALVYALGDSLGIALDKLDAVAVAVECIHTYSLIHDDLPDMDNDDLRRGQPACHKQFRPSTAILAGDALNTLAFEILADNAALSAETRIRQVKLLAQRAGIDGMVGGQDTDLYCEQRQQSVDLQTLKQLHRRKTAKLIEACLLMAYQAHPVPNADKATLLSEAALSLGLLYQIQDDILDVTQTSEALGKPAASDISNNKSTYVSILGLDKAKQAAAEATRTLEEKLNTFFAPQDNYRQTPLADIIDLILRRDR